MQFDELAVKYFDNDLSQAEQLELDRLFSSSPEFKIELNNIAVLDKQLESHKTVLQESDLIFLGDFGNDLISSIEAVNIRAKSPSVFSRNKKLTALLLLLLGFVALIPAFFVFWGNGSAPIQKPNAVVSPVKIIQNVAANQKVTEIAQVKSNKQVAILKQEIAKSETQAPAVESKSKNELSGKIIENNAFNSNEMVASLQKELTIYQTKNDILNQAIIEKKLGILLRDNNLSLAQSEEYLIKAVNKFRLISKPELLAEAIGELGKLESRKGNKTVAQAKYEECLNLLKSVKSSKVHYWEKVKDKNN